MKGSDARIIDRPDHTQLIEIQAAEFVRLKEAELYAEVFDAENGYHVGGVELRPNANHLRGQSNTCARRPKERRGELRTFAVAPGDQWRETLQPFVAGLRQGVSKPQA